jgi:hypothetical protein
LDIKGLLFIDVCVWGGGGAVGFWTAGLCPQQQDGLYKIDTFKEEGKKKKKII